MSNISGQQQTYEYVLDMLCQLKQMAKAAGLTRMAGRIATVVAAERANGSQPDDRLSPPGSAGT